MWCQLPETLIDLYLLVFVKLLVKTLILFTNKPKIQLTNRNHRNNYKKQNNTKLQILILYCNKKSKSKIN